MASFELAFRRTLQHEDAALSGVVTMDAGGRTRFGIAERFHSSLPESFFTGPPADALAEAERIERLEYWDPMRLGEVSDQNVANKLFDMAVNMGVRQATLYAQRAANILLRDQTPASPGVQHDSDSTVSGARPLLLEDGRMGPATLASINTLAFDAYHAVLRDLSRRHYLQVAAADPEQERNLTGWLKRADS